LSQYFPDVVGALATFITSASTGASCIASLWLVSSNEVPNLGTKAMVVYHNYVYSWLGNSIVVSDVG